MNGSVRHPDSWKIIASGVVSLSADGKSGAIEDVILTAEYEVGPEAFLVLDYADCLWKIAITGSSSPRLQGGRLVGSHTTRFLVRGPYRGPKNQG